MSCSELKPRCTNPNPTSHSLRAQGLFRTSWIFGYSNCFSPFELGLQDNLVFPFRESELMTFSRAWAGAILKALRGYLNSYVISLKFTENFILVFLSIPPLFLYWFDHRNDAGVLNMRGASPACAHRQERWNVKSPKQSRYI